MGLMNLLPNILRALTLLGPLLILAGPNLAQSGERYSSCCVCVEDDHDVKGLGGTERECAGWLRRARREIGCAWSQSMPQKQALNLENYTFEDSCRKVTVYGAFHGNSSGVEIPFTISAGVAKLFAASEVCYDGSSCLLFNNIDDVKACTRRLARSSDCRFEISANQNVGVTQYSCLFGISSKPHEIASAASKLTAVIDAVGIHYRYPACSTEGDKCSWLDPKTDGGAQTDPNQKLCAWNDEITTQRCCLQKKRSISG